MACSPTRRATTVKSCGEPWRWPRPILARTDRAERVSRFQTDPLPGVRFGFVLSCFRVFVAGAAAGDESRPYNSPRFKEHFMRQIHLLTAVSIFAFTFGAAGTAAAQLAGRPAEEWNK